MTEENQTPEVQAEVVEAAAEVVATTIDAIEDEAIVTGDVIAVDPYASQAHLPDEQRVWPPA